MQSGTTMDRPICLNNIEKSFKRNMALKQVSLQVKRGKVHGLIGPDGAGKTTLLRIAAGIMRPDSGTVSIMQTSPASESKYFSLIGYMPQAYGLYLDLSVWENILFFARMHSLEKKKAESRAEELLQFVGLLPFKKRHAGKLSGGMYKKLALCTALIHEPGCLLLDEPTNGVDPVSRRDFWELIFSLCNQGKSILISTPHMDEASRCHNVSVLDKGTIIFKGRPPDALGKKYSLLSVRCQGNANPISILSTVSGALEAYPVEDFFTVRISSRCDRNKMKARIKTSLHTAGLTSIQFVKRPARFEDVFLLMTAEGGKK